MAVDYLKSLGIGSGLDTTELVSAMVQAERAPSQASIDRRAAAAELSISGTAKLKSALQTYKEAFDGLNDANEFTFNTILNSDTSSVTTRILNSDVEAGSHTLVINQLAAKSIFVSDTQASKDADLTPGQPLTFSFQVGSGAINTVSLASGNVTLNNLSEAINDLDVGVSARVVEVSPGAFKMFLESEETGVSNAITIVSDALNMSSNLVQTAQDALIDYQGVSISRSSNQITDLIPGLELSLTKSLGSSINIRIEEDSTRAKEKLISFVDSINQFNSIMKALTAVETDGNEAGELKSDSTVRDIQVKLRKILLDESSSAGSVITRLSDIGISVDRYGVFQINETKLDSALSSHYDDVQKIFSANTNNQSSYSKSAKGIAGDALELIDNYLAYDGIISNKQIANSKLATSLLSEEKKLDEKMAAAEEKYAAKFVLMNKAIAEMNSLKEYLDNQLKNLPFTANNN